MFEYTPVKNWFDWEMLLGESVLDDEWEQWYFSAAGRWPSVNWPKSLYYCHLEIVYEISTRYPEDVFLSGAAGFDVSDAWSVIYEEYSSDVIRCLRRMSIPGYEPYDLWIQAIARMLKPVPNFSATHFKEHPECTLPPAKIVEFQGRTSLRNYLLLIAQNIGRDHLRKKEIRLEARDVAQATDVRMDQSRASEPDASGEISKAESKHIESLLKEALGCLTKKERQVLLAVSVLGMSNIEISKMYGYSASSTTRYRQSAVETMKRTLKEGFPEHDQLSDQVLGTTAQFFRRTLQCLADHPSS